METHNALAICYTWSYRLYPSHDHEISRWEWQRHHKESKFRSNPRLLRRFLRFEVLHFN